MVARAQHDGLPVTADVSAHHLHLTVEAIGNFDSQCHVQPPFRSEHDRTGLRDGLAQGSLAAVCSDHQPHEPDAKFAPFGETEPGISALETLLPLTLQLVNTDILSLADALSYLTHKPAKILGIDAGTLSLGSAADVCIFDPNHEGILEATNMISRGHNTPFLGQTLKGRVTHTFVNGKLVYELSVLFSHGCI